MTITRLLIRNLQYYRKSWLSILAGTVLSTAVLTGALIVGDSVRYSLGRLAVTRLGKIHYSIQPGDRFFRQQLAAELAGQTKSPVAAVLKLDGIAGNTNKNKQLNRVEVLGIDKQFLKFWDSAPQLPSEDEAIISKNTASKLDLHPGDEILLKIRIQSKASDNAPFVSQKEPLVAFRLKIASIADDAQMGRFSLLTNQSAPYNIFVNQALLARKVSLKSYANLLLIADPVAGVLSVQKLDSLVRRCWQPEDVGLHLDALTLKNTFELRSDRIFIDENTASAIQQTIPGAQPILTYLVNDLYTKNNSTPYSFVTATALPAFPLSDHEIIINNWLADDLMVKPGDSISLKYFEMGALRKLTVDSARFCIKYIVPITNPIFDRTLMPDFPGMSEAGNCREWETGAPVNLDRIRDKDEKYWNDYRGTPKAFISPTAGLRIWNNSFGNTTAFRFTADSSTIGSLKINLMSRLRPSENGLRIINAYSDGKTAAANSTDFGGLFLSLSFFIITAALLLTALLFSLHAQKRKSETAIMAAMGFRKKEIIRILFLETLVVIISGSILGTIAGVFYNKLILAGLNTLWNDAVRTNMLQMHIDTTTLLIGFTAGAITAMLSVVYGLLHNFRSPLSEMVKSASLGGRAFRTAPGKTSLVLAILFALSALAMIIYSLQPGHADLSEMFLTAGGLFMLSGIIFLYYAMLHSGQKTNESGPQLFTLTLRNVSMKKRQTITAVALLAIGTFSVIITGAHRKTFYGTEINPQSGTGGFLFWAESTIPVLNDLNSIEGKKKYGLADETDLKQVLFLQMLSLRGNDASCLNLNQVSQPTMLGIAASYFDKRQAFSFSGLHPDVDDQHPWLTLNKELAAGVIPCFADQTVITYGMQKKIGDTLLYTDENGKPLKIKIMGGLNNSVFQGNILVSAELFSKYFPSAGSSELMLIDGDFRQQKAIAERLEYIFQDFGMLVTPASERLAQFNSVENTYLSVFMLLGGLGVLIGTFGLGIVVFKTIREREAEMALYQAIGLGKRLVLRLVSAEYLLILISGLLIGTLSALIGLIPTILMHDTPIPWAFIAIILLVIFTSGLLWIFFPVRTVLRKNLVKSLRTE